MKPRAGPRMSKLPFHPLANLFPLMEGAAFDDLTGDIRSNGQREDIVTLDGMILDGRNRYRACLAAGVAPQFRDFASDRGDGDDPLAFVISKNLKRRNLNESQRALVAARLATMRQGKRTDLLPSATLPKVAQSQAAALMSVSARLLRSAKTVQEKGAPALVRAVEQGRLSVSEGAIAAQLDFEQQEQIAAAAEAGQKSATRTIVKRSAREAREAALGVAQVAGNLRLPTKRYGVIVADPEWRFEPWSRKTGMDRAADNHYPTFATEIIAVRDVASIAADDCVLFLWTTAPMLPQSLTVMAAWGFDYKTHLVWHKLRSGNARGAGYWATGEHEVLLIGTRGQIPAPATAMCASLIAAPWQGRHSAKPEIFLQIIEREFPTLPKIELNRRGPLRVRMVGVGFRSRTSNRSRREAGLICSANAHAAANNRRAKLERGGRRRRRGERERPMSALPNAENVVAFAPPRARVSRSRRDSVAVEVERLLSRKWVSSIRDDIRAGHLDTIAARADIRVKPSSALAVAKSLASPRYPSFWKDGVYARQSAIGADPDVALSGRHIARIIKLLVAGGYLKRAEQDKRKGRTCLLQPMLPSAANTVDQPAEASVTPDIISGTAPTSCPPPPPSCPTTPHMVSEESSDLNPNQKAHSPLNPPADPSGDAASGQASKSASVQISSDDDIWPAETARPLDASVSFEVFWNGSAEPRGPLGFALAQWGKLTVDQQRRACERPACDAQAGVWLRDRGFDLDPDIGDQRRSLEILAPYSAEWQVERRLRIAAGLDVKFMDSQARAGKGWTARPAGAEVGS